MGKIQKYLSLFLLFTLVLALANCSSRQAKESYDAAIKLEAEKKYNEAVKQFENVVKDFSKNEYAAKSLFELANIYGHQNLPDVKKEDAYKIAANNYLKVINEFPDLPEAGKCAMEAGKLYQSLLVPNVSKEESLKNAVSLYKKVVNKFPDSQDAEPALFMIGFIQANELRQIDSAKTTYQTFLQKYQNSKLVASVKMELDNLGATPEEILKKKDKQKESGSSK